MSLSTTTEMGFYDDWNRLGEGISATNMCLRRYKHIRAVSRKSLIFVAKSEHRHQHCAPSGSVADRSLLCPAGSTDVVVGFRVMALKTEKISDENPFLCQYRMISARRDTDKSTSGRSSENRH